MQDINEYRLIELEIKIKAVISLLDKDEFKIRYEHFRDKESERLKQFDYLTKIDQK